MPNTDEEISAMLAGESLKGPRSFRGQTLAPLTRGLRDLRNKVISQSDTVTFHDAVLLHILAEAHADTPDARSRNRRALMVATDDVPGFRARVSELLDDFSDEDDNEARRLVGEILGAAEKAEVAVVTMEKKSTVPAEPSPTPAPSPSSPSPESFPDAPTTS